MKKSNEKIYGNDGNSDVISFVPADAKYILDIGCGNGAIAKRLSATGHIVDGITLSEQERNEALPFMRQVSVHNAENGLPFPGSEIYDTVICSHVLEHICYPSKLLRDIHRVLKPDGSLIVALPNLMHYKSRMQLMKGNFNYMETGIWDYTHFRWYTFQTALQLLEQNEFRVQHATVTGELPLNSFFGKILSPKISRSAFTFLTKISKGFFGYQLLFVARKK